MPKSNTWKEEKSARRQQIYRRIHSRKDSTTRPKTTRKEFKKSIERTTKIPKKATWTKRIKTKKESVEKQRERSKTKGEKEKEKKAKSKMRKKQKQ